MYKTILIEYRYGVLQNMYYTNSVYNIFILFQLNLKLLVAVRNLLILEPFQ